MFVVLSLQFINCCSLTCWLKYIFSFSVFKLLIYHSVPSFSQGSRVTCLNCGGILLTYLLQIYCWFCGTGSIFVSRHLIRCDRVSLHLFFPTVANDWVLQPCKNCKTPVFNNSIGSQNNVSQSLSVAAELLFFKISFSWLSHVFRTMSG